MDTAQVSLVADVLGGLMGADALNLIKKDDAKQGWCPSCEKNVDDYGGQCPGCGEALTEKPDDADKGGHLESRDWIDHLAAIEGISGRIVPAGQDPREYFLGQQIDAIALLESDEEGKPQISEELLGQIADRMKGENGDDWLACLSVALDKTFGNFPQSIQIADKAAEQLSLGSKDPAELTESKLLESGFTGVMTDKRGAKRKYQDGKEVPMNAGGAPAAKPGAAQKPAPAPKPGAKPAKPGEAKPGKPDDSQDPSILAGAEGDMIESLAKNTKTISALNKVTGVALSAIGGIKAAEHWMTEKVKSGVNGLPAVLRMPTLALYGAAMASYTAGNHLAKKVAIEKGMTPEQAEHFGKTLATWDILLAKPAAYAAHVTHVSAAVAFIPAASLGYVAMSAVTNPIKTLKAAGKAVGGVMQTVFKARGDAFGGWESIEEELMANGFSGTVDLLQESVSYVCSDEMIALIEAKPDDGWKDYMGVKGPRKDQKIGYTKEGANGKPVVVYGTVKPGSVKAKIESDKTEKQKLKDAEPKNARKKAKDRENRELVLRLSKKHQEKVKAAQKPK